MRIILIVRVGNTLFRYGIRGDKYFCIIKLTVLLPVNIHVIHFCPTYICAATASLRLYTQKTTIHTFIGKNATDLW